MPEESSRPERGQNRRRRRHSNKNTSQRNYASENDMQPSLPKTPQKSASASPAPFSGPQNQGSTRRGNRARPRHLPLSPDSARVNRQTSPHLSSIQKSVNVPAFAGATFHASPAPSSLPLPSFFKAPESPTPKEEIGANPVAPQHDTRTAFPTPLRASSPPVAHESPLEFMFKADREERERARQTTEGQDYRTNAPPLHSPSSMSPTRKGITQGLQAHSPSPVRYARPDMARSTPEFDNHFGNTIGPSFSTPYHERIRAAKNSSAQNPTKARAHHSSQTSQNPSDKSEALKRYLFGTSQSVQAQPGPAVVSAPISQATPAPTSQTMGHAEFSEVRDADVVAMENNLRRLLKLDSS